MPRNRKLYRTKHTAMMRRRKGERVVKYGKGWQIRRYKISIRRS